MEQLTWPLLKKDRNQTFVTSAVPENKALQDMGGCVCLKYTCCVFKIELFNNEGIYDCIYVRELFVFMKCIHIKRIKKY